MTYTQEALLAMELDQSHVGALVQIITESWSMTGTLTRVDQHDNKEWALGTHGQMIPAAREIYTELWIGPWTGRVIGNQPVTVERVKGTLEAPERGPFYESNLKAIQEELEDPANRIVSGDVVEDLPPATHDVHRLSADPRFTVCGQRLEATSVWAPEPVKYSLEGGAVTCRECKRRDLPPAPADWPDLPSD